MKKITFIEGVGFALFSSIVAAFAFTIITAVFFSNEVLKLIIVGLSFTYLIYLFSRSNEKVGRVLILTVWLIITLASLILFPSLFINLGVQLTMVWLIRSLYFYNSIFPSLIDLLLVGTGLIIAIWAWFITASLFLTFWCFFLVQALFAFVPKSIKSRTDTNKSSNIKIDNFEYAYRSAEVAVSNLINSK